MKLSHVHIPVTDLDRAVEFYEQDLGWGLTSRKEVAAFFAGVGVVLESSKAPVNDDLIVGIATDDVDGAHQALVERGFDHGTATGSSLGRPQLLFCGSGWEPDRV